MKPRSFVIFSKNKQTDAIAVDKLCEGLMKAGFELDEENPELIIVLGGDGSLLRAFHEFRFRGDYVLINTGHLGFFSDYPVNEADAFLHDLTTEDAILEPLPLFKADYNGKMFYFVSDITLQSERTCELSLQVNGEDFTSLRSSGIVVGSPIASTGFLASLDSPIVLDSESVYQYAAIAPVTNRLFLNPIRRAILDKNDQLSITIEDGGAYSYLDGIYNGKAVEKTLTVSCAEDKSVSLLHFREISEARRIRRSISGIKED
jgi:NAD+ kinase